MCIDNQTAATRMLWIIILAINIDMCCFLMCILFKIDSLPVYIIIISFFVLLIFRLKNLKYFKLEIAEELISIKYYHPLNKRYSSPKLELPWYKVRFFLLRKGVVSHYICIGVISKRKDKVFYFNLGVLSKSSISIIETSLKNSITNKQENI